MTFHSWSHPSRLTPSHLLPTPFVPSGHFPLIGGIGPRGRLFTAAPRDCCQARRASKQGKQKSNLTHRRAAAGGERSTTTSLHPRRSISHQASLPDGSPGSGPAGPVIFGYFPSLESTSPAGETLLRPQKTKLPWTFTIHGSVFIYAGFNQNTGTTAP